MKENVFGTHTAKAKMTLSKDRCSECHHYQQADPLCGSDYKDSRGTMCANRAILFIHYAVEVVDDVGMTEALQDCSLLLKCRCVSTLFTYHSLDSNGRAMEAGFVNLHGHKLYM